MGVQYSRAAVAVDHVVNAGISAVVKQVQDIGQTISGAQVLSFDGCDNVTIKNVQQKQFLSVDFSVVSTQMSSTELSTKVTDAVTVAANAEATGGLGLQGSDADTAVNSLINISQSIVSASKVVFSSSTSLTQTISCTNSKNVTLINIVQDQVANVITSAIISQSAFTSAMEEIVSQIDGIASAKTKGYDPIGSLALIAIAVILGFLVFTFGGASVGLNMAKNLLKSPYFWIASLGALSAVFAAMAAGELFKFWPYQKASALDKPADTERKKKINTAITVVSSIGLAASLIGVGGVVYFTLIRKHK